MAKIFYSEVDDFLRKEDRHKILENSNNIYNVDWQEIIPDKNNNWLTEGLQMDWDNFNSIGNKEAKSGIANAIFKIFSNGSKTNRDAWVFNFNKQSLSLKIKKMIEFYNEQVWKYSQIATTLQKERLLEFVDNFVDNDETKISWSGDLKESLIRNHFAIFKEENIRLSFYRPFTKEYLYFDRLLNNRVYQLPKIFPLNVIEKENLVICVSGLGSLKPFHSLMVNYIPELSIVSTSQCFPFYTYNEDGTNRRENITDWALNEYRQHYKDENITKWDIFYYIYGTLHKPEYRTKYAANLRRELPRIPFYDDFWKNSEAGKKLADLHVNYEEQPEYPLTKIEAPGKQLDYRVEKMKLSKDKQTIIYNDFLSLTGIPLEAYEYKLGNRSALEWIIDQYQIKTDKRSGIVNDPNRTDEPDYIIKLIGKIVTVSIETVKIVKEL